ncbi:M20 family metallo-hydrolase [Lactobacillaceae bacterium Melli_B3]
MINTIKNNSLLSLLKTFSLFGKVGTTGVTRKVYDEQWIKAQSAYAEYAKHYGLNVFTDEMGNVYAATTDQLTDNSVIMTGSHIDTVENGGRYDGTYGDLASLVAVGELYQQDGAPETPLVAVSFSEEEGSRFETTFSGSKFATNQFDEQILKLTDDKEIDFETARKNAVSHLCKLIPMIDHKLNIQDYLELHIEQGPILEKRRFPIGVVSGITGQIRVLITIEGTANHAGTTPMDMRNDALRKAIPLMKTIYDELSRYKNLRFTMGKINVEPNVTNVIPNRVTFSVDMRDLDQNTLDRVLNQVRNLSNDAGGQLELTTNVAATKMADHLVNSIKESANDLRYQFITLSSGAGHDAQVVSYKIPTGMIFVPSINGISHAPDELTSDSDLQNGYRVLKQTLKKLAY